MRKLGCFGLIVALAAVAGLFVVAHLWGGQGPLKHNITVADRGRLQPGRRLGATGKGGRDPLGRQFPTVRRFFGSKDPIKAGEYRIPAHLSQADILKLLQGNRTLQRFVTIPEGWPSVMVKNALMKTPGLQGNVAVPIEGTILPDSYSFERGDTRAFMVQADAARDGRATSPAPGKSASRASPSATPREALILASIVEKETGKPSERRLVAAVYSNRLKRGMPLQADPTMIYPVTKGLPLGRRILRSELQADNGYNTYAMAGLPIGPIANPGRASIDAVLDPAQSNALYFVADGTGGHVFADTLAAAQRQCAEMVCDPARAGRDVILSSPRRRPGPLDEARALVARHH